MLIVTVGWAVFFHFVSAESVVAKIGIQNAYAVAFIVSTICGFSSITSSTFYIVIAALTKGGANFFLIGIFGGVGVCLSDFIFYYVVSKSTYVIDKHWNKLTLYTKCIITFVPKWVLYALVFVYSGFFPLPNDVLLVALALGKIPFKKVMPYVFAGDIVSTLIIAYLAR
jgi:hypothetical protein